MGNICRSPTAHGVFRQYVKDAGLAHMIEVDSAGTHAYHVGEEPDARSQAHAIRRGYDLSDLKARQVCDKDFNDYEYDNETTSSDDGYEDEYGNLEEDNNVDLDEVTFYLEDLDNIDELGDASYEPDYDF